LIMRKKQEINLVIEKAASGDLPAIMDLLKIANMHYIGSAEMPSISFENYFVAKADGKVVGFCGYRVLSPIRAKTELMVVHPDCRGMGVGYKLQRRRMEDMLARGIRTLTTNTDLPETIEWYKKHFGYRKTGELKKVNEFGSPDIDRWTTLEVDLVEWNFDKQYRSLTEE